MAEAVPSTAWGRSDDRAPRAREVPTPAGVQTVFMDESPRCNGQHKGRPCGKLLAEFVSRPWRIRCSRCGTTNVRNAPPPPSTG